MDSSILCEIQLLEGAKLSLSYRKATDKESSSLRQIPICVELRTETDFRLRKTTDPPGTPVKYFVKVNKRSRAGNLFDRVALLENVADVGELRFFCGGVRMGEGDRLCDLCEFDFDRKSFYRPSMGTHLFRV